MKKLIERPEAAPRQPRRRRTLRRALLAAALLVTSGTWFVQRHVVACASPHLCASADAPRCECVLVPGARIYADGTPCSMLVDRLAAARSLFLDGVAPVVVVSGRGGGGPASDEVGAMRRWLEARGVSGEAIVEDPRGLRTLDSLRNCREVLGMRSAVVVSNDFHVARAVFLGRRLGLETYGVVAPPLFAYSSTVLWKNRAREVLARVRACVDVYL